MGALGFNRWLPSRDARDAKCKLGIGSTTSAESHKTEQSGSEEQNASWFRRRDNRSFEHNFRSQQFQIGEIARASRVRCRGIETKISIARTVVRHIHEER